MKKMIFLVSLILTGIAFSQNGTGVRAKVELVSGVVQYAQFLGIHQDTVSLGGNIQGKFTIIKLTKNRFKSIVDENGVDLLNPPAAQTEVTVVKEDSTQTTVNSDIQANADSSSTIDSTASSEEVQASEQEQKPTFLDSVQGKHVFVALERRSIDSALAAQVTPILMQLLKESGTPLTFAERTDFGYCREASCIKDSLTRYGAASLYQGTIAAAAHQDSLILQVTHSNLSDSSAKTNSARITLSVFKGLSSAISNNKLGNFVKLLKGESIPRKTRPVSYIKMESDPEGATITVPGKDEICRTPCTFATLDTSKTDIYAYWNVNDQIWAIKKTIHPIPEDTTKISVKLKKAKPELRVFTVPEGAYIYAGSTPLTPRTSHIGKSPNKFPINEPGTSYIQIRKEGYRDTLVSFFASPTEVTNVNVTLTPISNPVELELQKQWVKERKKSFVGKVLMGSSVAPILAGALLTYLGTQDYNDAQAIKDQLKIPASLNGEHYQAKVKENHDLVKKGDRKIIAGGSLVGTGLLMFGIGILLTF